MSKTSRGGVQVSHLTWTPFASSEPLLNDISFEIGAGRRVLLIGPSGSGKSTLLRAIAGVLADSESGDLTGKITTDGVGLLLQDPADSLVSDNIYREVAFGLENTAVKPVEMPKIVQDGLAAVAINKPLQHPSTDLSGGEMQRMAFAGVMAMKPAVILLDEPGAMLDAAAATTVREVVIKQLEETKATLIVVEHDFVHWLPLVERVLVLNASGQLVFDASPKELLKASELGNLGLWLPGLPQPTPTAMKIGEGSGGRIIALTGASGAGKTTELKRSLKADPNNKTILTGVGYLPQQAELTILGGTVFESAHATAKAAANGLGLSSELAEKQTRDLLQKLGLGGLLDGNPYDLSGGEQRRLGLATALAHSPMSVYLDEPTAGQDRESWAMICGAILAAKAAGMKLTIATHDQRLIALADEVVAIEPTSVVSVTSKPPLVSGLVALLVPLLLLLGSMRVTSITAGVAMVSVMAAASVILAVAGLRIPKPQVLLPGMIAIISIGLSNWYLGDHPSPETGLIAALRVSTFVLPGIALASQLRPIELGDQLAQWLRLPARPVLAAVAAMQRLQVTLQSWDELRFIHRIRGVGLGRGPKARISEWSRLVFGLLVQSIRSAGATAVAMDSRGFSHALMRERTWAAKPRWACLDWRVTLLALVAAILPLLVA